MIVGVRPDACNIATGRSWELLQKHRKEQQPLLLKGLASEWSASANWTSFESFAHRFASMQFPLRGEVVSETSEKDRRHVTLGAYFGLQGQASNGENGSQCASVQSAPDAPETAGLLFDFNDLASHQSLMSDLGPTPAALLDIRRETSVSIGRAGRGSSLHSHLEAWQAQILGRKLWLLAPPGAPLRGAREHHPCALMRGETNLDGNLLAATCTLEVFPGRKLRAVRGGSMH